ncbi:MAG: hypothetical protein LBI06_03925, partial [Treponema sp.]|nr:hypothetical protein [Treponema sp.]
GELRDDAYVFPSWNHLYGTWKDSTGRDEIVLSATEYKYTIGKAAPDSAGFLTIAPLTFTPVYNTLDLTKANYILGYDVKGKYTAVNANFPAQVVGEDSTVRLLFDKTSRTKLSYGGADGPTFRYEKQP